MNGTPIFRNDLLPTNPKTYENVIYNFLYKLKYIIPWRFSNYNGTASQDPSRPKQLLVQTIRYSQACYITGIESTVLPVIMQDSSKFGWLSCNYSI